MDKKEGHNKKHNAHHSHTPTAAKSQESAPADRATDTQQDQPKRKPRFYDRWTPEWASVIVQALALVVLIFYTVYTKHQWETLKDSNGITRNAAAASQRLTQESNRLTARGLAEGKRQSQAALSASREQSAEALNESRRQADSALAASREEAGRALKESKRQSDAAARLASEALEVSRRQMVESLRAKVFIDNMSVDLEKQPPFVGGNFRNSGALAAEGLSWGLSWAWGKVDRSAPVSMTQYTNPLIPSGNHPFGVDISLPKEAVEAIKEGTIPLWIWVRIKYGDRLNRVYPAETACFTYNAHYKWMVYCEKSVEPIPPEEVP